MLLIGEAKLKNSGQTLITDFTEGNVSRQLILFATPLFLSNLLQVVYNMVDMVVVGQFNGRSGLSAVAIGGDVSNFLTFVAIGFSAAAQVIISQFIGADQKNKVGKFIGTMFSFLMGCAMLLTVICLVIREPILRWMSTPNESWSDALYYSVTCTTGLVFIYGYNIVSAIMRGMGDSKRPFIFISIAAILNIILDVLFVGVLGLGAFGAALATVISQTASFISALVFLYRYRSRFGFEIKPGDFRIDPEMLTTLVRLGVPMSIRTAAIQFSKMFVNSWINSYGVVVSAVAGIGNKFNKISILVSNSMTTAGSSMVGQNIGAQKYRRVTHVLVTAFTINLAVSTAMAMALVLFPKAIFRIFTSDAAVLDVANEFLPVAVLMFISSAFRSPAIALVNGSANHRVNIAMALLDAIVMRIGLAMVLGFTFTKGYLGFWYGNVLASFTPFVIGVVYYISGRWKTRKYVIREEASGN